MKESLFQMVLFFYGDREGDDDRGRRSGRTILNEKMGRDSTLGKEKNTGKEKNDSLLLVHTTFVCITPFLVSSRSFLSVYLNPLFLCLLHLH